MNRGLIGQAKGQSSSFNHLANEKFGFGQKNRSIELDLLISRNSIIIWTGFTSDVQLLSYLAHKSNKCFAVGHTWSYKPRGDHVIGKCHGVLRISVMRKETFAQKRTWTLFLPKTNEIKVHLIYNSFMNSKVKMLEKELDRPNLNYVAVLENVQSVFFIFHSFVCVFFYKTCALPTS